MANMTVKDAVSIKGTNPQYLIEKIIRSRIYESRYWKEECFALTAELLVDKAMELKYIGGAYAGNIKPTPFLCLTLKMLQIQPEKDIVIEFIRNEEFKYVRFLGAFYMRLTGTSTDVFKYLEPLYVDYRKMKKLGPDGKFELVHMDEMIDELLRAERVCNIALPRLQKRHVLEELNQLEIRVSPLDVNLDELESSEDEEKVDEEEEEKKKQQEKKKKKDKGKDRQNDKKEKKERRRRSVSSNASDRKRSVSPDRDKDRKRSKNERRGKYVDYDNPEENSPRYRRSESPRRRRSRSRSDDRDRRSHKHHRRDDDNGERRHKRDKYDRDRRSRSRSKERKHKKKEHRRSRSRTRSRSRS